jgi:hypothetical protein
MTDEEIKQRIRYLVEHGGLWDDPHDDIRRGVNINRALACATLGLLVVDILVQFLI